MSQIGARIRKQLLWITSIHIYNRELERQTRLSVILKKVRE